MDLDNIGNKELKILAASVLLIIGWLAIPLYLQAFHGVSAIKASFGVTVVYYIGFKLWKRLDRE